MRNQKGITLIGMLLTMAVVVACCIVVMRVVPVYIQYYSITQSIKALNTVPASSLSGDPMANVITLRASLTKRLDINEVEDLSPKELVISPIDGNKYKVKLDYQVIRPLVGNVSLLFDFKDTYEVKPSSEN